MSRIYGSVELCPTVIIPGIHVRLEFDHENTESKMGVSVPTFRPNSYGFPPRRDTVERGSEAAPSSHQKAATECDSTIRSFTCQSSNEPSGRKRRTMRGIFPSWSSFIAMASGSVSPSRSTRTGAFILTKPKRIGELDEEMLRPMSREKLKDTYLICSALVPSILALSYFVM